MIKAVGDEIEGVLATPCAAAVHANVDSCPAVSGHWRHYWQVKGIVVSFGLDPSDLLGKNGCGLIVADRNMMDNASALPTCAQQQQQQKLLLIAID